MTGAAPAEQGSTKRLGDGSKYSRADVLRLKELFDEHDSDADGRVTVAELLEGLEGAAWLQDHALSTFRTMDINKNCILTFNEYLRRIYPFANEREFKTMLAWATPSDPPAPMEPLFEPTPQQLREIRTMFERFDTNQNNAIDIQELLAVASHFGYAEADMVDLFKKTDKNMNGSISLFEFIQLMKVSYI